MATAAGDEAGVADGYFNLGHVSFIQGDDRGSSSEADIADQVIARFRDLGDERGVARASWAYGVIAMTAGRVDEASDRLARGLRRVRATRRSPVRTR